MSNLTAQQKESLDRLIAIAKRDTGQSRRVANFLLSWWNADSCGGFDFRDFWNVDGSILEDMWHVLAFIATNHVYPDELGYKMEFDQIIQRWRPRLDPIERTILEVRDDGRPDSIIDLLSTSERCTVALALDRPDRLPAPYADVASAWERLDNRQRSIVARYNSAFSGEAQALCRPQRTTE